MNVAWTINLDPLDSFVSTDDYTIFSNNSLLMRRTVEGSYQCGTFPMPTHQFRVILFSKWSEYLTILMNHCVSNSGYSPIY